MTHRKGRIAPKSTPLLRQLTLNFGDSSNDEPENRSADRQDRGSFPDWMRHVHRTGTGEGQG
jgi:hypothetical protein